MKKPLLTLLILLMIFAAACGAPAQPPRPSASASPSAPPAASPSPQPSPSASSSPQPQVFTVATVTSLEDDYAAIRAQRSTSSDVIAAAVLGARFTVYTQSGGWCGVLVRNRPGYIESKYLRLETSLSPAPESVPVVVAPPREEMGLVQTRFNGRLSVSASTSGGVQRLSVSLGGRLTLPDAFVTIENGQITAQAEAQPAPSPSPSASPAPTPEPVRIVIRDGKVTSISGVTLGSGTDPEIHIGTGDGTLLALPDGFFEACEIEVTLGSVTSGGETTLIDTGYFLQSRLLTDNLVDVAANASGIKIEMLFAQNSNLLGQNVYGDPVCLLQAGTLEKLKAAQAIFEQDGYRIIIYDAYRPYSVTEMLWNKYQNSRYVAGLRFGSVHNKGAAVDMSLIGPDGEPVEMPSPIHTLNETANRSYSDMTDTARANMDYMTGVMERCGFDTIASEWWHFSDADAMNYLRTDYDLSQLLRVVY